MMGIFKKVIDGDNDILNDLKFQKNLYLADVNFSGLDSDLQHYTSSRHRRQSINVLSVYDNGYFGLEPSHFDTAEQYTVS